MSRRSAGRSNASTISSSTPAKLTLTTRNLPSTSSLARNHDRGTGTYSPSPTAAETGTIYSRSKSNLRHDMSYYSTSSPLSAGLHPKISSSGPHAKLHKRAPSTSSVSSATTPTTNGPPQLTAPFVTIDDPFPEVASTPSSGVPKIRPYLRKMSAAKEDQGMIDLSKSTRENDRLAGLGIQDLGSKSAADVNFTHSRRGQQHGRNISNGSQMSNGSARYAPSQPFTHPMAKTPRPYTPPTGSSHANSLNDEEANESEDIVEGDFRLGNGLRHRGSVSASSTPANLPNPLSQSHTASELGLVPKITGSTSQSNLSLASNQSDRASSKKNRPRRGTDLSQEYVPSPSTRPSFDKAFSFASKRSEANNDSSQSRDERILEARRRFEEKEANKNRKREKEASKRQESEAKKEERQRQKSDVRPPLKQTKSSEKAQMRRKSSVTATTGAEDEKFQAKSYDDYRPANAASLPRYGILPGESEKTPRYEYTAQPIRTEKGPDGGWMRFSTWFQTRMLSCGGKS